MSPGHQDRLDFLEGDKEKPQKGKPGMKKPPQSSTTNRYDGPDGSWFSSGYGTLAQPSAFNTDVDAE